MIIEAIICAYLAKKKGRSAFWWGVGGFFTSWVGVAIVASMPPTVKLMIDSGVARACPWCNSVVPAVAKVCARCGRDL